MNVKAIFRRRELWTIALYKVKTENEIFEISLHDPFHFFGERGIRRNTEYQAITADPFLFVRNDRLYIFYEIKTDFGVGEIWAQSMDAKGAWTNHGQVLKEDFHLSYPQVFEHQGEIFMIPEAAQSGKVLLYRATGFPFAWTIASELVAEGLLDPTMFIRSPGDIFMLATTREYELRLLHASDIRGPFVDTGRVVTRDRAVSRCAGRQLCIEGNWYRLAQDCEFSYGREIHLLKIEELSADGYRETRTEKSIFAVRPAWAWLGYHHVDVVRFGSHIYVAIDGYRRDRFINTITLALLRLYEKLFQKRMDVS